MELKGWIARDERSNLCLYDDIPMPRRSISMFTGSVIKVLEKDSFPEVTWENSPQEVTIKIEKR